MFIHWGLYSQDGCFYKGTNGGSEHMMQRLKIPLADYAKIADDFNPTNFNANEWAGIAKNAGMEYMVLTSKHHDGFAMYDSESSDYNIVKRTPWHRDPVAELAAACRKQGLKFGFIIHSAATGDGSPAKATTFTSICSTGRPTAGWSCQQWA